MRHAIAFALVASLSAPAAAEHHVADAHQALVAAVADESRGESAERDEWRHPIETLEFFQVEPGMTVLDYYATGGWYTEILAPYLGTDGHYIGTITTSPTANDEQKASQRAFPETFGAYARDHFQKAGLKTAKITAVNLETMPKGMEGTVDRVLIFRYMHNMHRLGMVHDQLTKLRNLLKPDGMLGIVQHRARPDAPYSYSDGSKGYMRQEDVVKLVEAHGFELVGSSEINANPNDTADHDGGVWEMPPTLASKDEALKDLGESDRMTLLFRKRP